MWRLVWFFCLVALTACTPARPEPDYRGFDLRVSHPHPRSTYMLVSPAQNGATLPRPQQIESRAFAVFFRHSTGCARDTSLPVSVLGHRRAPAGYMVPVRCP